MQAHQLRLSGDEHVKLNVYVSRDTSPEEAKLAYEERSRCRQKWLNSSSEDASKSRSCVDVNPSSDLLTTGLTRPHGQQESVSSVTSVLPAFNDVMQFPPLDSNRPSVSTNQDKQQIPVSSQWYPTTTSISNHVTSFVSQQVGYVHHPSGDVSVASHGQYSPPSHPSVVQLGPDVAPYAYPATSTSQPNLLVGPYTLPTPAGASVIHSIRFSRHCLLYIQVFLVTNIYSLLLIRV